MARVEELPRVRAQSSVIIAASMDFAAVPQNIAMPDVTLSSEHASRQARLVTRPQHLL